jgi:repressor LexA
MPRKVNVHEKLEALRAFYSREHRVPSYREMLGLFNYRSKNAVFGLLEKLKDQGYITKARGKIALTPKLLGSIRLLGSIEAGFPSPAEEELVDTLSLDAFLVEHPESTFMLKVTGDSMIDAGIHPGDMVLVDKGVTPKTDDIVIAAVDGEWTMKYFVKKGRQVQLEPANRRYSTIVPKESLEIAGVVRSVIRKYS